MSERSAALTSVARSCALTSGGAAGMPVIGPVRESGAICAVGCALVAAIEGAVAARERGAASRTSREGAVGSCTSPAGGAAGGRGPARAGRAFGAGRPRLADLPGRLSLGVALLMRALGRFALGAERLCGGGRRDVARFVRRSFRLGARLGALVGRLAVAPRQFARGWRRLLPFGHRRL